MEWDIRVGTNGQQPYSSVDDLTSFEQNLPPHAYCLSRYARPDGTHVNTPSAIPIGENGYISMALSDQDGAFRVPPMIIVTFDRPKTSNGVSMVLNKVSEDYANRFKISWYKDAELVQEQEFEPDRVEYFCRAKVPLFSQLVITYLETDRPYRYLWLSVLKSRRMIDAGGSKIVHSGIALGASGDNTAALGDHDYYVDLQDLKSGVEFPDYAMYLPKYARMNGNYNNAPDELADTGYVSDSISDEGGTFGDPSSITFTFGQTYSSVGITLRSNDYSGDYCSTVNIKWYRGDELLSDWDYPPDSPDYFCYGIVDYYNRAVVTFPRTNKPYRNVFLTGITWGLIRVFKDDEIEDISCLTKLSPISEEVSINTMGYTIRSKSDYTFEFQKRQKQMLYLDETILGIFYLKDGRQLGAKRYSVETQGVVGILDNNQFMDGVYNNALVSDILVGITAGEGITYSLDDVYVDARVNGYLPICTKRVALQQLAFVIGALVNTSYDQQLYIRPQQTKATSEFTAKDIRLELSAEHSDIITGIRLYVYSYTRGMESAQLYKGILDNTTKIEFSEPHHSLSITGGILEEHGDDYACTTGTGNEVVLTGPKYNHSMTALLKEEPKIAQNKNTVEVKGATLVTTGNMQAVFDRVYGYYSNNESISFHSTINDWELGNRVNAFTDPWGAMTGNITKPDFKFSRRKVTVEVTVR